MFTHQNFYTKKRNLFNKKKSFSNYESYAILTSDKTMLRKWIGNLILSNKVSKVYCKSKWNFCKKLFVGKLRNLLFPFIASTMNVHSLFIREHKFMLEAKFFLSSLEWSFLGAWCFYTHILYKHTYAGKNNTKGW